MGQVTWRFFKIWRQYDPLPGPLNCTTLWYVPPFPARMCAGMILISPSILGPVAGDPFPSSTGGSPPAVIPEFFDEVCPTRTIIDRDKINGALGGASAATILQAWLDELERTEDRCVEIKDHTSQIFDFWYVLFPSPALRLLGEI